MTATVRMPARILLLGKRGSLVLRLENLHRVSSDSALSTPSDGTEYS
jgi:hypothetical protein